MNRRSLYRTDEPQCGCLRLQRAWRVQHLEKQADGDACLIPSLRAWPLSTVFFPTTVLAPLPAGDAMPARVITMVRDNVEPGPQFYAWFAATTAPNVQGRNHWIGPFLTPDARSDRRSIEIRTDDLQRQGAPASAPSYRRSEIGGTTTRRPRQRPVPITRWERPDRADVCTRAGKPRGNPTYFAKAASARHTVGRWAKPVLGARFRRHPLGCAPRLGGRLRRRVCGHARIHRNGARPVVQPGTAANLDLRGFAPGGIGTSCTRGWSLPTRKRARRRRLPPATSTRWTNRHGRDAAVLQAQVSHGGGSCRSDAGARSFASYQPTCRPPASLGLCSSSVTARGA